MSALWPVTDRIQAQYEALRTLALSDAELCGPTAARFARQGLAGLISWKREKEPPFNAAIIGAQRPAWMPYADPRLDALATVYQFVLELGADQSKVLGMRR